MKNPTFPQKKVDTGFKSFFKKLEEKIVTDSYIDVRGFVNDCLLKGLSITGIVNLIKEKYGLDCKYSTVYNALKGIIPVDFNRNSQFLIKNELLAQEQGFPSFRAMLLSFKADMLNYQEIANILGIKSSINVKRLEKIYKISLGTKSMDKKEGFTNNACYRRWLKIATDLGFLSVQQALTFMKTKGKSDREIGEKFNVSAQCIWRRRKAMNLEKGDLQKQKK